MVHAKPHAAGRTLARKAGTGGTGPGDGKGRATAGKAGRMRATVKGPKVFRFSAGGVRSSVPNEKSACMVVILGIAAGGLKL